MSAYYRRAALRKKSPSRGSSFESEMNESGYTSFLALHNSTAETPFLLEDAEGENCRNASNTTTFFRGLNTPSSHQEQDLHWGKPYPRTQPQKKISAEEEPFSMTPRLQDEHSLPKRRKKHFQSPHSSPKKSKKLLFPHIEEPPKNRFYGGVERLDIVAKLAQELPALECILRHVGAHTLDVMTKVSPAWKQAVYRSQRALERLQNHLLKLNLTKENPHVPKRCSHVPKANHTVPLQTSNHSSLANSAASLMDSGNSSIHLMDVDAGRVLREQTQRVKCPRCGRGSRVFISEAAKGGENLLSQTLPIGRTTSTFPCMTGPPLKRFLSLDLDEVKSSPQGPPYNFAECTSVICQFRFCVNCLSKSHPGERCLVTELDTPSKLMMPRERLTPPQRAQSRDPKITRKNSLKRLCF
ncbi:uncharacterized protein LOC117150348 [Drosophila mauritiana]|uniref:Uncharacterized protein LOC117150348 n=1 Tax=Drosophila mauritiana TaxID=7226 RepID=A0A6P8LF27_DROMA|nr:uncharacterized protein LOC117150348 [Drosophila mauritiana]